MLLQVVPDGVGSLADEDHVGLQQPLDDVSLGDELGVVGDGDVGGVAQDLGGDVVDVPRHDGAPDDDVLVGQLVAVDLLQQVVQLRGRASISTAVLRKKKGRKFKPWSGRRTSRLRRKGWPP